MRSSAFFDSLFCRRCYQRSDCKLRRNGRELKHECLQVFDSGLRLNPVTKKEGEAIISAFVIFSEDKSKVELFIEGQSLILDKVGDQLYQHEGYTFDAKVSVLFINGIKKYAAEKGRKAAEKDIS